MAEKAMQWLLCRIYGDKKGRGLTRALLGNTEFAAFVKMADDRIEEELNTLVLGRLATLRDEKGEGQPI